MFVLKAAGAGLTNLQQAGRIHSGDILNIKVIKSLGGSSWQISVKGKLLAVSSAVRLTPGLAFQARAQVTSGQLLLKMVGEQSLNRVMEAAELPNDELSRSILQSFIKSGIPVSPERTAFLYRYFKQITSKDKSLLRLMTLLLDKGVPMERSSFDEIIEAVEGRYEREGREGRHKQRRKKQSILEALKSIVETEQDEKGNLLQLFNHLRGGHGSWLVVPFAFATDRGDLTGCIRCKIRSPEEVSGKTIPLLQSFSPIVMELREQEEKLWFVLSEEESGTGQLTIVSNRHKISDFPADVFNRFRENLQGMDVALCENITDAGDFDGFDFGGSYTPVDAVI
jgi:hypothetical protein